MLSNCFDRMNDIGVIDDTDYNQYRLQLIRDDFIFPFQFDTNLCYIEEKLEQEHILFNIAKKKNNNIVNEQKLSQEFNQLFGDDQQERKKRRRLHEPTIENDDETTVYPDYLFGNKNLFDLKFKSIEIDREHLRQWAFAYDRLYANEYLHRIWSLYLQSGTGQWKFKSSYWPKHVQSSIIKLNSIKSNDEQHQSYQQFVEQHLEEHSKKMEFYQKKIIEYQTMMDDESLEKKIIKFVQDYGLPRIQVKYNFTIGIFEWNAHDHQLQCEYQQEQPNQYQLDVFQHRFDLNLKLENSKNEYIADRQRLLYNQPSTIFDCLQCFPQISNSEQRHSYEQLIQQTKTDLMVVYLNAHELYVEENQFKFKQHSFDKTKMTTKLLNLIEQREKLLENRSKIINQYFIDYYLRLSLGKKMISFERIGFLNNLKIDPIILNIEQLLIDQRHLLERGPTYIAPCQIQVQSLFQSIDTIVQENYQPLRQQLANLFQKHKIDLIRSTEIHRTIKKEFHDLFATMIPTSIRQRALNEQQLIQSIQSLLKQNQWILTRTGNNRNQFYLGLQHRFEQKCQHFFKQSQENYELLWTINEQNQMEIDRQLNRRLYLFNQELEKLKKDKKLSDKIYRQLHIECEHGKLSTLYFLPHLHVQTNTLIDVQPMFSSYQSLTWKLNRYLYELLQPIIHRQFERTMITDDSQFIQRLHQYCLLDRQLQSTTIFVRIQIENFHSMISNELMLDMIHYFLHDRMTMMNDTDPTISISTIKKLFHLFFQFTFFIYEKQIFRFIRGLPSSMLLSQLLSNIYLQQWQKCFLSDRRFQNQLFVRRNNELFFTWNHSNDDLQLFLQTIVNTHLHLQMTITTGQQLSFQNVWLENRHGQLYTRVYHHSDQQQQLYTLPFIVGGHSTMNDGHWFRSSLIRAGQLCSNVNDFIRERFQIEITCLLAGYPLEWIDIELKKFYTFFEIQFHRFNLNESCYERLRRRLFNFIDEQQQNVEKDRQRQQKQHLLQFSFLYDYGPYHLFKQKFQLIWSNNFKSPSPLSLQHCRIKWNIQQLYSLYTVLCAR